MPTCVFLEREVYAFLSGFAAQCCGPAFFVYGKAAEGDVGSGRWTAADWSWAARAKSLRVEQHRKSGAQEARGKREEGCFSFSWRKDRRMFACSPSGGGDRSAATAALGIGTTAKMACARTAARDREPSLWRPFQLIDLRYLCVGTEREKWMDVCSLLTLYI